MSRWRVCNCSRRGRQASRKPGACTRVSCRRCAEPVWTSSQMIVSPVRSIFIWLLVDGQFCEEAHAVWRSCLTHTDAVLVSFLCGFVSCSTPPCCCGGDSVFLGFVSRLIIHRYSSYVPTVCTIVFTPRLLLFFCIAGGNVRLWA